MKPLRLIIIILALALVGSLWFGYGQKKRADGLEVDLTAKDVLLEQTKLQLEEQRNIAIQQMMMMTKVSEMASREKERAEANLRKTQSQK